MSSECEPKPCPRCSPWDAFLREMEDLSTALLEAIIVTRNRQLPSEELWVRLHVGIIHALNRLEEHRERE